MMNNPLKIEFEKLRESSRHAVIQGDNDSLDELRKYLHIERPVERNLESLIKDSANQSGGKLILVCGNVGDGKSHVLSYLNHKIKNEISCFKIHNDATEAHKPNETSIETLSRVLSPFCDNEIENTEHKLILAINLGTLNNFLDEKKEDFQSLYKYVEDNQILSSGFVINNISQKCFKHVNFTDYHMYSLAKSQPKSDILSSVFNKIFSSNPNNLFFKAYLKHKKNIGSDSECPILYNYEFLLDDNNKEQLIDLIIQAMVKTKEIISMRSILNFIYDIIIPVDYSSSLYNGKLKENCKRSFFNNILPNYIFEHKTISSLLWNIGKLDPYHYRTSKLDEIGINIYNSDEPVKFFIENGLFESGDVIENSINALKNKDKEQIIKLFTRLSFFRSKDFAKGDEFFYKYMQLLFDWNRNNLDAVKAINRLTEESIRKWNGDSKQAQKTIIDLGKKQTKYRVLKKLQLEPIFKKSNESDKSELDVFLPQFTVTFKDSSETNTINVDYELFKLFEKIQRGYRPNRQDTNNNVSFANFTKELVSQEKVSELWIDEVNIGKESDFLLTKDSYGDYKFVKL
ncbi:DNA phosphorothioation-dependent restriction protein DptF [Saccharicrinis sp. 156]|uniref:DNA phosphorothioation-dependent restriction protein DptF n=1 Tax=Saccharicrinis sp. 156 TaxID=3417574 RepID=UPI003D3444E5